MEQPKGTPRELTAPKVLARNTLWSLVGQAAPMVAALTTIPFLIRALGVDRFGVLSLAWMIVGYFSLFDLGLARALTKLVADRVGGGKYAEVPPLLWTALGIMVGLGVVGAAAAMALTSWAIRDALKIPEQMRDETAIGFYLMALAVPAVTVTAALRGFLEANQKFGVVNALKAPLGVFNYVGPAVALLFSQRIDVVVAVLVVSRYAALIAHFVVCWEVVPEQMRPVRLRADYVRPLLSFGGWMTVSNVISPLMVYFDRFAIGAAVSLAALSFYVTPYEMITKLWVVPGALVTVLFPAFSASLAADPRHAGRLLDKGMRYVFLATFPITLVMATLGHLVLRVWVGEEMAVKGTQVLQWLSVGVFVNGMAAVPFAFLHGAGRPDLTAKLHLLELPFYAALLWWAVNRFGIEGAAVAWTARVTVDTLAIIWLTRRSVEGAAALGWSVRAMGLAVAWMLAGAFLGSTPAGLIFLAISAVFLAWIGWHRLLGLEERTFVMVRLRWHFLGRR